MNYRCTSIFLLLCCLQIKAFSQDFQQSVGVSIAEMHASVSSEGTSQSLDIVLADLTYFPKINLWQNQLHSLSLGIPISVGVGLASEYSSYGKSVHWNFDLPLALDFNSGFKSTNSNRSKYGWYLGTGFGYTFTNWSFNGFAASRAYSFGPLFRGGLRFGFPSSDKTQGLSVGLYYKLGLESQGYRTIGCNILFDL